jgi:poly(hydroxyalkanoate) depolymerase family esterase
MLHCNKSLHHTLENDMARPDRSDERPGADMPKIRTFPYAPRSGTTTSRLTPLVPVGPNPGALTGYTYVPADLAAAPALVVVLHGCTQTAAGYDHGSGWSTLADQHGFVLLLPEQQRANNANLCFNWFEPGDTARDRGEAASIRAMIAQVVAEHNVDPARIFVTGLSAGGAMAAVMLSTYPETFAAGAIIAGLPYGFASSVPEALERMRSGPIATDTVLAGRVRAASAHAGRWPRLSIWQGDADRTVNPINADALVRQWASLHGVSPTPTRTDTSAGHPRRVWVGLDGNEVIEDHLIAGMGHGTPLAPGEGAEQCGTAGAYMLDVGVSSSHAIARFWGIAGAKAAGESASAASPTAKPSVRIPNLPTDVRPPARRLEVIARTSRSSTGSGASPATGVQGIIEDALRSAGLMK